MRKMLKGYALFKASKTAGGALRKAATSSRGRKQLRKGAQMMQKASHMTGKRKNSRNKWMGIGGIALGALAAGAAIWGMVAKSGKSRKEFAQSGQAPGRSHIQRSSHPASQKSQPPRRTFGG